MLSGTVFSTAGIDAGADLDRQVVHRERERLALDVPAPLDLDDLGDGGAAGAGSLRTFSVTGARAMSTLTTSSCCDALVEILEEAVVLDRLQDLGQVGRDERALALHLDQQVLAYQLAQRLADRDPADFQLAPELVLGRDLQPGAVLPRGDAMADDLFDLVVERDDAVFATARSLRRGSARVSVGLATAASITSPGAVHCLYCYPDKYTSEPLPP